MKPKHWPYRGKVKSKEPIAITIDSHRLMDNFVKEVCEQADKEDPATILAVAELFKTCF